MSVKIGMSPILWTIRSSGRTDVFLVIWTMSNEIEGISERRVRRRELAKEMGRFNVKEK